MVEKTRKKPPECGSTVTKKALKRTRTGDQLEFGDLGWVKDFPDSAPNQSDLFKIEDSRAPTEGELIQDHMANTIAERDEALEASITDPLTQLFNRRYFDKRLPEEVDRACRSDAPVAVIYMDCDHFKNVNDTLSHSVGDNVLKKLAEIINNSIRKSDVASFIAFHAKGEKEEKGFRMGGEEFAVILPSVTLDVAELVAERIRETIEEEDFVFESGSGKKIDVDAEQRKSFGTGITSSFGVTIYEPDKETIDQLERCRKNRDDVDPILKGVSETLQATADAALYDAKESERNCVRTRPYGNIQMNK